MPFQYIPKLAVPFGGTITRHRMPPNIVACRPRQIKISKNQKPARPRVTHACKRCTPVRCTPGRCTSVRCTSVRCTSVRCKPVRYTPVRCTPMRYIPMRCIPVILICGKVGNRKWTLTISISRFEDFCIGATCGHWRMEILVEVNARLRAMIAQNEDAELEHK
jgi:hypothetical protein